jgi:hypothetical protein
MRLGRSFSFAVAILASGTAFAGTPGWSISESSGQVSVVSTGLVKAAVRGGAVATGDIINTGRNGRAVLVRGEEYLVVSPNTRIRVADPAKSGGLTQIVEHFGNVIYKIKKMTMPHFAVETPFLAAVVKGTTFSVTVTEKGASVQVIEGRVEVATRDGGASYMVLPGDIGSVSAKVPGTLNLQGRENRSISTPTPAAAAAAVTASVEADAPAPTPLSTSIETPVTEGAVNLSAMSDGMVSGDSSMTAMASMSSAPAREAQSQAATPAQPAIVEPVLVAAADPTPVPLPVTNTVVVVEPTALPPTPAEAVEALPPTPAPAVDPAPAPPVGGVVDPVPTPLPPTPTPVDDTVPAPLPPTPAPAVDPAPTPLPPAPAVDPAPTPLPPAPIVTVADPTPAGPAIVEPVQIVTVAPTAPAPSPTVTPAPTPVAAPLPAPAPTAPVTNSGTSTNWNGGNRGPGGNWNGGNGGGGNQNDQGQNED